MATWSHMCWVFAWRWVDIRCQFVVGMMDSSGTSMSLDEQCDPRSQHDGMASRGNSETPDLAQECYQGHRRRQQGSLSPPELPGRLEGLEFCFLCLQKKLLNAQKRKSQETPASELFLLFMLLNSLQNLLVHFL